MREREDKKIARSRTGVGNRKLEKVLKFSYNIYVR
nr:MAG TPA: hypothetical protein [Caudoviricetes sp.]